MKINRGKSALHIWVSITPINWIANIRNTQKFKIQWIFCKYHDREIAEKKLLLKIYLFHFYIKVILNIFSKRHLHKASRCHREWLEWTLPRISWPRISHPRSIWSYGVSPSEQGPLRVVIWSSAKTFTEFENSRKFLWDWGKLPFSL